jgi:ankyrin repeat protein
LEALLAAGADACAVDADGLCVLHLLAHANVSGDGARKLLGALAKAGVLAQLELRAGECSRTPLMEAAAQGAHEALAGLLEMGADIAAKDGSGLAALDIAMDEPHREGAALCVMALRLARAKKEAGEIEGNCYVGESVARPRL